MVKYEQYLEIRKAQSNYEYIKGLPDNVFLELIKRGFLSIDLMSRITIYECFLSELKNNKKSVAITYTAEKYNLTEKTIYNIINFMKS